MKRIFLWIGVLAIALGDQAAQGQTSLASEGQAAMPVVVAEQASERVRQAADMLADYLGRISGASFERTTGDGQAGIAVGIVGDFPALGLQNEFDAEGPAGQEQYLLRSHTGGVYVLGATELAVEHAVWDLLYRLGHRQFFPGKVWEVVPEASELTVAVDVKEKPDYLTRNIWYGFGTWGYNEEPLAAWRARNRAASVFNMNTGHAYGNVVRRNKAEFDAHPEYFCHVDGKPTSKLCAGQPGLRALVVRYALDYFEKNPDADTVSIDPSDGGGWCVDGPCVALGPPTNRALTLANDIAEALEEAGLDKYVAMYAYNEHSPPPSIRAHPRVIINVATGFIRGGYTVDALLAGWQQQGVQQFGIREYYSVTTWDRDLPGRARGGNLDYLARTIAHFHQTGARFMSAESSDNWGPNGLGYYLATRMMWDVDEANQLDTLQADFFDKAFGPARSPMASFYALLDGANKALLSDDLLGRMYRLLDEAATLADGDPAIQARLDDLIRYTRYVELYRDYSNASGKARQAAFEQLIRHTYRIRETMMVHAKGLYRDLDNRDRQVSTPEEAAWNVPEDKNPWKSSEPFTRAELDGFMAEGIAKYELLGFQAVAFSQDLIPAAPLHLTAAAMGQPGWQGRGHRVYYTWIEQAPAEIRLQVTGGLIAHYRDRGDVQIRLYPADEVEGKAVDEARVPPDGEPRDLVLRTDHVGLHRLELSDGHDMTRLTWQPQQPITFETSTDAAPVHSGRQSVYFYVPRGTTVVGGYATGGKGGIYDGQGKQVHAFGDPGFFEVPVPAGQAGKLWSLRSYSGQVQLMTVPPYVSHDPAHLLLPREVVEADASSRSQ